MGFRSSKKFNDALLAKLTWMVLSKRDSCCMKALRSKYKVRDDWMHATPIKNASQTWKAIKRLKRVIAKGVCFLVGDGTVIDIWKDPWVPWLPNFVPQPKEESTMVSFVVSCLIDQNTEPGIATYWSNCLLKNQLLQLNGLSFLLRLGLID